MSSISAGLTNSTSIVVTGDNTGNLVLKTNGTTTAVTIDTNQNATFANSVTVTGTINATISGNGASLTDINASNISSGTISNARTTGASANGASTIVARDTNGSFAGNVVTATNVSATTGSFTDVSGNGAALTSINASNISSGTIDNARTSANSSNVAATIVLRGATGEFDAGAINAASFTGNGAAISGINASNIASGTIDNARTTAASANGASTIVARDSNGSFTANAGTFTSLSGNLTGNVTLTTGTISTSAANSTDIVNKAYVDGIVASGVHFHEPVLVEEDANLVAVYAQPNGAGNGVGATLTNNGANVALVIDGVTLSNTARVLVLAQSNAVQNGVYTVTNPGNASAQWVLTRSTDTDTYGVDSPNALSEGSTFFVSSGNTGAGRTYTCNTNGTITFGTTNITFAQVSTSQIYAAGTGLNLSNLTFSIANTAVTAATYGNDGAVPQIAINAQGQITAASNVSINASSISVGTLANGRTTADSANGASTIVARDSNGSFSANVVTAGTGSFTSVSGNGSALTAINASNISSGTVASARISGSYTDITGVGTLTAGTWNANAIGAQYGGTGSANLTANNVILGNGTSAVQVVAPGTANNVLTSNGTTWISQAAGGGGTNIPAGTVMIFGQTSAPTGFTKLTDQDNAALRVVSGSASTGGSVNFTTAFASQTPTGSVSITSVSGSAGSTTLSTPQIPSHTHTYVSTANDAGSEGSLASPATTLTRATGAAGGGGSHTHPFSFSSGSGTFSGNAINLAVKYVDVIRATKD